MEELENYSLNMELAYVEPVCKPTDHRCGKREPKWKYPVTQAG